MLAHHLRQSRRDQNIAGSGCGTCAVDQVWPATDLGNQGTESQAVLAAGKGVRQVARMAGISPASVSRIKTSMSAEAAGI